MEKTYKFRIYPNDVQAEQIQKTFGCCRFVFNRYLAMRKELYENTKASMKYKDMSADMTKLKAELEWLSEADSVALQSSLRNLDRSYENFFRRVKSGGTPGFPRFKSKKDSRRSYTTKQNNNTIEVLEKHIKLPKLGKIRCAVSKEIQGRILSATVSQAASGKYFVSVCCTEVEVQSTAKTGKAVGLDLGLSALITMSDGQVIDNLRLLKNNERRLARAQRRLSRKAIGSRNRDKARLRVAREHERIANSRSDKLHKLTTELVKGYDTICIEGLNVKSMVKNRRLARSISDAAWGELVRQLEYKCDWYGKTLIKADTFFASSQLCSCCGYKNVEVKSLAVRRWACPECGAEHGRDENAAINLLNDGLKKLA